jgi:hypothetical protein
MNSKKKLVVGLVAVALAAPLAACGGDDDDSTTAPTPGDETTKTAPTAGDEATTPSQQGQAPPPKVPIATIFVNNGKPVGGPKELEFDAGEDVRFLVASNGPDEIHIHGYDVTRKLRPGKATVVSFPAELEGIFEVELHGSGEQIAELRVNP